MSRTYRNSYMKTNYGNVEGYLNRTSAWYRYSLSPAHDEAYDREYYNEWLRDGRPSESGRNQGYKDDTNGIIRVRGKRLINKIMKDVEVCDTADFPDKKNGKFLLWCYW